MSQFRKRIRELGLDLNRLYYRHLLTRRFNNSGVDIFTQEWDTLVILDACRYDLFSKYNNLPGRLEKRESKASATLEFFMANFAGRRLHDTVYVTATPQFFRHREQLRTEFHDVFNIWKNDENLWKDRTPLPETTTEFALRAYEAYPDKRLIVHYTQPHHPFIAHEGELPLDGSMWNALREGRVRVSTGELWEAYGKNLSRALPHVKELMDVVDGRTIVTSDHGNMLGERGFPIPIKVWGHPHSIYQGSLVEIPWLIYDRGDRREVTASLPKWTLDQIDNSEVSDRLRDLGYE